MDAVERQKSVSAKIVVVGHDDWRKVLPAEVEVEGKTMSLEEYLQFLCEVNRNHLYERGVVGMLLQHGFELEELVVESSNHPEWGVMTWLKDHPVYHDPPGSDWERDLVESGEINLGFWRAMFNTEQAGVQNHCLYSTAVNAAGLHKSFVYHRVVFSEERIG